MGIGEALMDLYLKRTDYRPDGIFGEITSPDFTCYTLEHAYANNGHGFQPKVPSGTYTCVRGTHKLEHGPSFETFEVTGVEGHSGILFHVGNVNGDSDGCILLGLNIITGSEDGMQTIHASREAFNKFINVQAGVDSFTIVIE